MTSYSEDSERKLVQVFEECTLSMLETIHDSLLRKELAIELHVGFVMPLTNEMDTILCTLLQRGEAQTMSWSNVID